MKKIMRIIGITMMALGMVGFGLLVFKQWVPAIVCLGIFTIGIIFGITGLKKVHQEERMVVELFGKFYEIKKPGLRWVCPIIMSVRAIVPIWEQTLVLFKDPIKIDFKDGSAVPKGVKVFVRMKGPGTPYRLKGETIKREGIFRAIYYVNNWRERTVELLENAVRSYLATLAIDEALPDEKGGYDLLTEDRMPKPEKQKIKRALELWGLKLERITVTDFDLSPEIVKARDAVQERKRAVETAELEKQVRSHKTTGTLIQMLADVRGKTFKEIQEEMNESPELKEEIMLFSQELITRQMSIDNNSLTDIRVSGTGGDALKSLLTLIAAYKQISEEGVKKPTGKKKPQKEQTKRKRTEEDDD